MSLDDEIALLRRRHEDAAADLLRALKRGRKSPLGNIVTITREEAWDLIAFQAQPNWIGQSDTRLR